MRPATSFRTLRKGRRMALALAAVSLVTSACGSRLAGQALRLAEGASSANGIAGSGASGGGSGALLASPGSTNAAGAASTAPSGSSSASGATSGSVARGASTAASSGRAVSTGVGAPPPSGGNGGATDVGVTATTITIANIASISGVAPGLTQSAQQATEAFAAYVNSQGGIYGRMLKVLPFDDGNTTSGNYADAVQACKSAFALVGSASGFDDGSAQAVSQCGIPDVAAEVSTTQAGNTPEIYGASPGEAHYWPLGPPNFLKSRYPNAVTKAAMLYLNVPATADQAQREMQAYSSVGFHYIYTAAVSPTEPNYAPYVLQMQEKGVQYVTEYSDVYSAERLVQAMQQQNWQPQVVDWFAEMYTPGFITETQPWSNGDLVLMATAAYSEASSNPGMQTFLTWMNRVAPGFTHDIFAIFAWAAGLAFLQAAKAVGPDLTRSALLTQLSKIGNFDADGLIPPENFGQKIMSPCFSYFQIEHGAFVRLYPPQPNTYDCTSGGLYHF
jgi:ABC-type branched-subunit amino acid transport system substrate-binding protein